MISTASSSTEQTIDKGAGTEGETVDKSRAAAEEMDENRVAEAGLADKNSGTGWRLAGDRDPEKWADVKISNSNLQGKLALAIPGLGGVTGMFVGRGWIGWVAAGLILIGVLFPWKRVCGRKSLIQ